jgi:phytanoyl-CoA hydroxylase
MLNFVVDSEIYLQSDATGATMLTLKSEFAARGYVVQKGVLVGDELEALRAEADRLRAESAGSTQDPGLSAAGDVLCIEFPHKTSAVFHAMLSHPRIVDVLTEIIGANVKCMESMLFLKPGGHPGQAWHQDEAFIPTRDRSLLTTWIALDDATVENGCLWVVPGSQRPAVIWPQEPTSDPEFDDSRISCGFPGEHTATPLPVCGGEVVFFDGYLLHKSHRNRSIGARRALVNHYMSAESLLPWNTDGRGDNRDIVLVAGEDPYAWKGIEHVNSPRVRRWCGRGS